MPEGDTVWLAGRRLHDALAGHLLTASDLRVPKLAATDLAGRVVREVVSRGKHLLTRLDDDRTLHTHFRMDGAWHLYRHGDRWRGGPGWQVRAVLETAQWQAVGYRLPVVELLRSDDEAIAVGHLGPDLLGPDWDRAEAMRRLAAAPGREIGQALLDQRNLAGIGSLYQAESLFLAGVSPWSPTGDVADLAAVVDVAVRLMRLNRDRAGQPTTGVDRRGQDHWVYGRAGRPCRRCGSAVRAAEQGAAPRQRLTFWCPRCQPETANARPHPR